MQLDGERVAPGMPIDPSTTLSLPYCALAKSPPEPLPERRAEPIRYGYQAQGEAVKRRSRGDGEPIKPRRRTAKALKRRNRPKTVRRRNSFGVGRETEVARLTRERAPAPRPDDLLPKAKALRPDVLVIMITAYGDAETKRKALENGAEALLTKPIDFGTLRSEIDTRIERTA